MMEWRSSAVCTQVPWGVHAWFFGDDEATTTAGQHEKARMLCFLCPVQIECLRYCVESEAEFGLWGGLSVSQRKRYLAPRLRAQGATDDAFYAAISEVGRRLRAKLERVVGTTVPEDPHERTPTDEMLLAVVGDLDLAATA